MFNVSLIQWFSFVLSVVLYLCGSSSFAQNVSQTQSTPQVPSFEVSFKNKVVCSELKKTLQWSGHWNHGLSSKESSSCQCTFMVREKPHQIDIKTSLGWNPSASSLNLKTAPQICTQLCLNVRILKTKDPQVNSYAF